MSDTSQGPGWWLASDGKWYPPEQAAGYVPPAPPASTSPAPEPEPPTAAMPVTGATPVAPAAPQPEPPTQMTTPIPPPIPPPMSPPPMSPPPPMAAPPAGAYVPAGPPPKKSGNGCLKAFLIVFALLALIGVGLVVVFGFVVKKGVDSINENAKANAKVEQRTGIKSNSAFFNSNHPPQDDISTDDMTCTTDANGNMSASGTVKNHSSKTSVYTVSISFRRDGNEIGQGSDVLPSVDAGATGNWIATSSTPAAGPFTCRITEIDRWDFGTIAPTSTAG